MSSELCVLLIDVCRLVITAIGIFFALWAVINALATLAPARPAKLAFYKSNVIDGLICSATLLLSLFIVGCTPRTGLEHEYHVASISINGVETRTDFLLTNGE